MTTTLLQDSWDFTKTYSQGDLFLACNQNCICLILYMLCVTLKPTRIGDSGYEWLALLYTTFRLYRDVPFYLYPCKTTDLSNNHIVSSKPYHMQESFIIYSCVTGQHKLVHQYTVDTLCIKVERTNDIISNYPSTEFELSRLYYTNKFHNQP